MVEKVKEHEGKGRMDVMDIIYERARAADATIILPEAQDVRIQEAAQLIERMHLAKLILIDGTKPAEYFNALPSSERDELLQVVQKARRGKKDEMSAEQARVLLTNDTKYLAAAMVRAGKADGFLAGSASETADTILPAVKVIGTLSGYASSFFIMKRPGETLFYADCAFNIDPDAEELAKIAVDTARNVQSLDIEPRIAFLSYSTNTGRPQEKVTKLREAIRHLKEMAPDLMVAEHEMQFDAAYVPEVAARKAPHCEVAGRANVFIFPDLNSGNIAYKISERFGGFQAIGPIFQGMSAAVNDLSRGCSIQDILDMTAVTAMQAGEFEKARI